MSNLLPCPFCNHTDIKIWQLFEFRVICNHCKACVIADTEAEAVAAWNTRTSLSDHYILLAVQRQVAGLVAEKLALQQQIDALVLERDAWQEEAEHYHEKWTSAIAQSTGTKVDDKWYSGADELTDIGLTYRELNTILTQKESS